MSDALPPPVGAAVARYLRDIDRLLPGVVTGFYVVGSTALGAYRERRSDIDFIAVVTDRLTEGQLRRVRMQHLSSLARCSARAIRNGRWSLAGNVNGNFIVAADLARPVSEITPVAGHVGHEFKVGEGGSDVSPVGWKVFAERGIAVRGPQPSSLGLQPEPDLLASWNLGNLEQYWRWWARRVMAAPRRRFRVQPRWSTAWGVLGAPRLHCTIATGEIVSKEAAGEYALDVFDAEWHPIVLEALAYWREQPVTARLSVEERARTTAAFVETVIESARRLPAAG